MTISADSCSQEQLDTSSLTNPLIPARATTKASCSSTLVQPRLTLCLPGTSTGTVDHCPPNNITTTTATPEACNTAMPPLDVPQGNLCLEQARAAHTGKWKGDSKTPSTAPKWQKISPCAEPTQANSIKYVSIVTLTWFSSPFRNICMCQWNKQQPNGQGLVSEFDAYFKALTNADKEVC